MGNRLHFSNFIIHLKALRDEKYGTQQKLADAMEVDLKTVRNWENAKLDPPACKGMKLTHFINLCEKLECDPEYLIGDLPTPLRAVTDISKETRLSTRAVDRLLFIRDTNPELINLINDLILDPVFITALQDLQQARNIKTQCDLKDSYRQAVEEIYNLSPNSYDVDSAKDLIHEYEAYADTEIQKGIFGTVTNMSSKTMAQMYYMAAKESMGQAFFRLFNQVNKK